MQIPFQILEKSLMMWYHRPMSHGLESVQKRNVVPVRIVTDSNCDLPEGVIEAYGISVVPLHITIGAKSYLDGVEMSRQAFYEGLPRFAFHPTTSVPSPGEFYEVYERLAAQGATQLLSIHISESLSAVTNSARLAAEETDVAVTVFDSGNLTLGTGLQVLAAAQAAAEGRTVDEIVAMLEERVARTYSFAVLDTLEFLRRSGRLSRFQSGLGALLQIKPLLRVHAGEIEMERVRTAKQAVERLLELVRDLGPLEEVALVHTHAPERVQALRQRAEHLFPQGSAPLVTEVTPVIGAHVGPGAVGLVAVQAGKQ